MAATLAHAAIAFQDEPALSAEYWRKAQMAYAQTGIASKTFGNSNDAYSLLGTYYPSSGVVSHVFFGAASMFAACQALSCPDVEQYRADANAVGDMKEADGGQKWFWEVPGWDNAWWDGALVMAQRGEAGPEIFGKPAYKEFLSEFADKWTRGRNPIKCGPRAACLSLPLCLCAAIPCTGLPRVPQGLSSVPLPLRVSQCRACASVSLMCLHSDVCLLRLSSVACPSASRVSHFFSSAVPQRLPDVSAPLMCRVPSASAGLHCRSVHETRAHLQDLAAGPALHHPVGLQPLCRQRRRHHAHVGQPARRHAQL